MTLSEFHLFLLCSAILCLVLALFNVLRPKKRRYPLSGALLAAAGGLILYRQGANQNLVITMGVIAFVFLVADFMVRARDQVLPGDPK